MKRDPVDIILQLAFLEGRVNTHGLYEQTVVRRKVKKLVSAAARQKLLSRLEEEMLARKKTRELPMTIGMFLRKVRANQSVPGSEISSRLGVSKSLYRKLEEDGILPTYIPVETWKKLREFFGLSAEMLGEMIRRTHRLVFFQPSFRMTLGRYREQKAKGKKSQALQTAARELYVRANLPLPDEEERKLSDFLKAISD